MTLPASVRRLWRRSVASVRLWRFGRHMRREAQIRERVDLLLGRVSCSGLDSLSPSERRFLYRASRFFRAPRERRLARHETAAP